MRAQSGLTLVEILVAMGILGIVLALITNWQTQTLQLTTKTSAQAQQMTDLNDLTGYVGDRVRSAVRVRVATSGLSVNSEANNGCTTVLPCLALVMPVYSTTGTPPTYILYIYRMQARSTVSADDKATDSWAENNVQVLREYRGASSDTCILSAGETFDTAASVPCVNLRNLASMTAAGSMQPYLVSDYLTPSDQLPGSAAPFTWSSANRSATITVQSRRQVSGVTKLIPSSSAYTLTVQARNVP